MRLHGSAGKTGLIEALVGMGHDAIHWYFGSEGHPPQVGAEELDGAGAATARQDGDKDPADDDDERWLPFD